MEVLVQQAHVVQVLDTLLTQVQQVEAVEQQDTVVDIPIHTQAVDVEAEQVVQVLTTVQHTLQEQEAAMAALAEHVVDQENRGQTDKVTDIYVEVALEVLAAVAVRHMAAAGVDLVL